MPRTSKPWAKQRDVAMLKGYRSGLEDAIAAQLRNNGIDGEYEQTVLSYLKPETTHRYTPDFRLPVRSKKNVYVETKGYFPPEERKKMLLVIKSNPDVEIRMLFSRASNRLNKTSPTTYAKWCEKHGIKYAEKVVPDAWIAECHPTKH